MADPSKNSQLCHTWSTDLEDEVQVSALIWTGWRWKWWYRTSPVGSHHEGEALSLSMPRSLSWVGEIFWAKPSQSKNLQFQRLNNFLGKVTIRPRLMAAFLQPLDGYFQRGVVRFCLVLYGTFHENCTVYTLLSVKVRETFTWFFCKFIFKDCQARKDHLGHLVCLQPVRVINTSAWLKLKNSFILFS